MGVPAFYRWVSEKYSKCVEDCTEDPPIEIEGETHYELVDCTRANPNGFEVDNLFIDMNGLIHPCSHPENGEAPKTEEEMYCRVMAYVDRLFAAVRPRKLLYLAIDGVAPRAKMNQQRARRFRAAQEAEERLKIEKDAIEYMEAMGHKVDESAGKEAWDSNVITPGTRFMAKLAKYLRFYIRDRVNQNDAWKSIKVILSDASVPGEGEHKLMSFLRLQRSQPGYDHNQRHVLHGLDADLIMLGLATHEVNFSVLREEVLFGKQKYERERASQTILDANGVPQDQFGKRKRGENGQQNGGTAASGMKPLQFLHVSTLREYLSIEFQPLEKALPFKYDFERIVDDFVFLCFFVGNDFIPHLPSLSIRDGALDFLLIVYANLLPSMDGYLTDSGDVNLKRVSVILDKVGAVEDYIFQRRAQKEMENDQRRKPRLTNERRDRISAAAARDGAVEITKKRRLDQDAVVVNAKYSGMSVEEALKTRIQDIVDSQLDKFREEVKDNVRLGEPGWKERYYTDKLKADDIETGGGREKVIKSYIEGLCWVMKYYYSGCASWQWFYPFHYAPFASDLTNIDRLEISFELGEPFRPFEQLMGVFPAASAHAIPKPYRWLMTDPESPIIDFYPKEILVDPNGKPMPWLWVVLLPFIDEARLLEAMKPGNALLTDLEKKRNVRYGKEVIFFHSQCSLAKIELPTLEKPEVHVETGDSESFTGRFAYVDSLYFRLGCVIPSPEKKRQRFSDIPNNQCYSFQYFSPPKLPHVTQLLENAIVPAAKLVKNSDRDIAIPFFGRANISIVDLAGQTNMLNLRPLRSLGPSHYDSRVQNDRYDKSKGRSAHGHRGGRFDYPQQPYNNPPTNRHENRGFREFGKTSYNSHNNTQNFHYNPGYNASNPPGRNQQNYGPPRQSAYNSRAPPKQPNMSSGVCRGAVHSSSSQSRSGRGASAQTNGDKLNELKTWLRAMHQQRGSMDPSPGQ